MKHPNGTADGRSASEIMAEARDLQVRHAPRALRRLQDALARLTGGRGTSDGGRVLTL